MTDETPTSTGAESTIPATEEPAVVADETCPPENDGEVATADDAAAATDGQGAGKQPRGKGGKRDNKREEVPIEELYDLSKPIKRVSALLYY